VQKYLLDSALSHYKEEIDRIKKAKGRASSVELQIRFNFKLGYLMELREDKEGGLRYYQVAYNDLQGISPISPSHYREIKGVSDWILLRICLQLTSLSLAVPRVKEAINMYKDHWLKYRIIRHNETHFEIWGWQVQMFSMFGQLLEGVNAKFYEKRNKFTLPGFYYEVVLKQTAAVYSLQRLEATRKSDEFMAKTMQSQELMAAYNLRFKEPFYVGQLSALAAHPLQDSFVNLPPSEQDLMCLMLNELSNDPRKDAMSYFNKAKLFYADLGSTRHMHSVNKQIADLHAENGDFEASEYLLKQTHEQYHGEGWPVMQKGEAYTVISHKLLETAKTLGRNDDLLRYLLEVMSLDQVYAAEAFQSFQCSLMSDTVVMDIEGEDRYMAVKSSFTPRKVSTFDSSLLEVSVLSKFPARLDNVSIELKYSESQFNQVIANQVALEPGQVRTFSTQVLVKSSSIQALELQAVVLHYAVTEFSSLSLTFRTKKTKLTLSEPTPKLSVDFRQSAPALIAEDYTVHMTFAPLQPATELSIPYCSVSVFEDEESQRKVSDEPTHALQKFSVSHEGVELAADGLELADLTQPLTLPLKFVFCGEGTRNLMVRVRYIAKKVEAGEELEYQKEDFYPLDVNVIKPFEFTSKWSCDSDYLPVGEVATLVTSICPKHAFATEVSVYRIALDLKAEASLEPLLVEDSSLDPLQGRALAKGEEYGSVFQVKTLVAREGGVVGDVLVEWSRPHGSIYVCRFPITQVRVLKPPIELALNYPSQTKLGSIFSAELSVTNCTDRDLDLTIKVTNSDCSFLYGGNDYLKTSVESLKTAKFSYVLVPCRLGPQPLPSFEVKTDGNSRSVKRAVTVLP
jgi:hypothetical protein